MTIILSNSKLLFRFLFWIYAFWLNKDKNEEKNGNGRSVLIERNRNSIEILYNKIPTLDRTNTDTHNYLQPNGITITSKWVAVREKWHPMEGKRKRKKEKNNKIKKHLNLKEYLNENLFVIMSGLWMGMIVYYVCLCSTPTAQFQKNVCHLLIYRIVEFTLFIY